VEDEVIEIIRSHMYPSGRRKIKCPHSKNFWIVKVADFFSAIFEIIYSILFLSFSHKNIKLRRNKLLIKLLEDI
jgi:hypothetical protein